MTVYIVTSGEYSDYCVQAVFTDQKQAELYVSTRIDLDREEYYIEKYETDASHFEGKVFYGISFVMTKKFNYIYSTMRTFISKNPVVEEVEENSYAKHLEVTIPVNRYYFRFEDEDCEKGIKIILDWIAKYKYRKEVDEK